MVQRAALTVAGDVDHDQPRVASGEGLRGEPETAQGPGADRYLAPEIEAAVRYVATGGAVRAAETAAGPLS